jgi:phosphosulfolactate phosphohydrolase-like enzyme
MEINVTKEPLPFGERKGFFVGFENLGNSPLSPFIPECELEFFGTICR